MPIVGPPEPASSAWRLQIVRRVLNAVVAVLDTEREFDRLVRPRQLAADRAEVAGDHAQRRRSDRSRPAAIPGACR